MPVSAGVSRLVRDASLRFLCREQPGFCNKHGVLRACKGVKQLTQLPGQRELKATESDAPPAATPTGCHRMALAAPSCPCTADGSEESSWLSRNCGAPHSARTE